MQVINELGEARPPLFVFKGSSLPFLQALVERRIEVET